MRSQLNGVEAFFAGACLIASLFVVDGLHNDIVPAVLIVWIAPALIPIALLPYHAKTERPYVRRRTRIVLLLLAPGLIFGGAQIYSSLVYGDPHNIMRDLRSCADHLRQIDAALRAYADEHNGHLPDRLSDLPFATGPGAWNFVCPNTGDKRPTSASELDVPGHLSYVYLGKGLTNTARFDTVIMYEPLNNHRRAQQMNVLFGDGHVEALSATDAQKILRQEKSGVRPIYWPPIQPSTIPSP